MKNIVEPVFIQAFIPKASVETLNKSVLRWLTWLDESQRYTMLKGPFIEGAAGKLRALIGSYCRRIWTSITKRYQKWGRRVAGEMAEQAAAEKARMMPEREQGGMPEHDEHGHGQPRHILKER